MGTGKGAEAEKETLRGVHHSSRELKAHFGFLNPPVPAAAAYYKDVVYVRAERKDSPREEYQSILAALEPMVAGCKRKLASFKRIVTARSPHGSACSSHSASGLLKWHEGK